jgi:hypothetical protein
MRLTDRAPRPRWNDGLILGTAVIGPPAHDGRVWTFPVDSALQRGPTLVRLALPATGSSRVIVLVLPVQAGLRATYGDGLTEVVRCPIVDTHHMAVAAPTFTDSPWGVDHASDPRLRQETHLVDVVCPLLAHILSPDLPRFALGFSKGGFAALNLLLRHPDLVAGASLWDASMLRDRPTPDQLLAVAGTPDQVARYHVPTMLRTAAPRLGIGTRLVLGGYGTLRADQQAAHRLLRETGVDHRYYDGPPRAHRWDTGWVPRALDELTRLSTWPAI